MKKKSISKNHAVLFFLKDINYLYIKDLESINLMINISLLIF